MKGSKRRRPDRGNAWQLRVDLGPDPVTGKRRTTTKLLSATATSREADVELARMVVAAREQTTTPTDATVAQLLDRWYDQTRDDLAPSTKLGYEWRLEVIRTALGDVRLSKLTAEHLDRFYRGLLRTGGRRGQGQAPATIRQTHAIVHRALALGVRWGWIDRNPADHATPPRIGPTDIDAPSTERVGQILAEAAAEANPNLYPLLRLAAATGARRGELCGLRWPRVDADGRVVTFALTIAQGPDGWVEKPGTKTGKTRSVVIDPGTAKVLEAHREATAALGSPWVFFDLRTPDRPWNPDAVTKAWRRLPSTKGVRLHDLRHWQASALLDRGVGLPAVSRRSGHSRTSTTADIYGHRMEGADAAAALILGGLLDDV